MSLVSIFGLIATITSFIGLIPQIYKTYQTKSAQDLSMIMLLNYLICSSAWIGYGIYTSSEFVVYSNIVCLATSVISILQKRYYDAL